MGLRNEIKSGTAVFVAREEEEQMFSWEGHSCFAGKENIDMTASRVMALY